MQLTADPRVHTTDDFQTSKDLVEIKQISIIRNYFYHFIGFFGTLIGVGVYLGLHFGLLSDSSGLQILVPLLKPPVDAACPTTLKDSGLYQRMLSDRPTHLLALSASDLKSRFFSPSPTNLFRILKDVDERIAEINYRFSSAPCMMGPSRAYNISTWGTNQTMYAQCAEYVNNNGYFYQWVKQIHSFHSQATLYFCSHILNINSCRVGTSTVPFFPFTHELVKQ